MIKLTETIVKRPVAALVCILAVIVFGAMAIFTMPQELTPDMDMPMLVISTVYPGAGPSDVESLVTGIIKDAVSAENGVRSVSSQSMENVSFIIMQFEYGTDIDRAYNHVSRSVNGVVNNLPSDALSPIVMTLDINAMPTMTLSITSDTRESLLHSVEEEIVPAFTRLGSVASVDVFGGRQEYVRVELIEENLREHRLTMHNIIGALAGVNHTAPLGSAAFGDMDLAVRVQVRHDTIEALNNIPLSLPTGGVARLGDVTNIFVNTAEPGSISRHNGLENITLQIHNPQAISPNVTSNDVHRVLNTLRAENPDLSIIVINDNSELIADSIASVAQTLILAIVLSMIILLLFLGDIRACLIVGSSMPISLLITFVFMDFMGFTMNLITLSGLIIGVGMMVDNSIVVIDSCFRARKKTRSFAEAAVEGTRFVMLSIFAVTLTTIVVFVPLAMIEGMAGQMFRPLGLSIVFALVASLISAITLVPLFFVQFKPVERENAPLTKIFAKLENGYAKLVSVILNKKKTVFAITMGIMALSIVLAGFLNFELMPPIDDGIVSVSVTTRPGLNRENLDAILVEIEEMVAQHPDVNTFSLTSGSGGSSVSAFLRSDRDMSTAAVVEQWRLETMHMVDADINISTGGAFMMPGSDGADVTLFGYTLDSVREGAAMVEEAMRRHPDVIRVNSTIARANPQAEIVVDPLMAMAAGLTPQMVTGSIFLAL
ncbi:MAG: efflux RND transporter permease subunit, partial [Defluviitaleaceae bacterium]|nr:efflux RND transporter permease subunit [Defluviitaleaceae bacterium]